MPRRFTIRVRGTVRVRRTITMREVRRQLFLGPVRQQPMLPSAASSEPELCPVHDQSATMTVDDAGQRHVSACCTEFKAHIEQELDGAV